jgi:hypothetical protein
VHAVLARYGLNAATHHPGRRWNPLLLHPFARTGVVVVGPLLYRSIPPRRRLLCDYPRRELIVSQDALPFDSVAKRMEYVAQIAERHATVVQGQPERPMTALLEGHYDAGHCETPMERLLGLV